MSDSQLRDIDEPLPTSSRAPVIYQIAIIALSIGVILAILLSGLLAWNGKESSDIIGNLGAICATALAAMIGYRQGAQAS